MTIAVGTPASKQSSITCGTVSAGVVMIAKSTASGAAPTGGAGQPGMKTKGGTGDKKKDFAAEQAAAQKASSNSSSGGVSPNTATTDKDKAKLTKEEKKAVSKDVGKGAAGQ